MSRSVDYRIIYKNNNFTVGAYSFTIDTLKHTPLNNKKFAILTAYNPDNNKLEMEENINRNLELQKKLIHSNFIFEEALGFLDEHFEESFCIYDMEFEDAIKVAKEYGQYSIYYHSKELSGYYEVETKNLII